jgi:hypothetical protein
MDIGQCLAVEEKYKILVSFFKKFSQTYPVLFWYYITYKEMTSFAIMIYEFVIKHAMLQII